MMNIFSPIKAIFLATAIAAAPAYAYQAHQLHGDWQCTTDYPDINVKIVDRVSYLPDGRVRMAANMTLMQDNYQLNYELPSTGNWQLKGRLIVLLLKDGTPQAKHNSITQTALRYDEQLQAADRFWSHLLSNDDNKGPIFLRIDKMSANVIEQTQLDKPIGKEMAKTLCYRIV